MPHFNEVNRQADNAVSRAFYKIVEGFNDLKFLYRLTDVTNWHVMDIGASPGVKFFLFGEFVKKLKTDNSGMDFLFEFSHETSGCS